MPAYSPSLLVVAGDMFPDNHLLLLVRCMYIPSFTMYIYTLLAVERVCMHAVAMAISIMNAIVVAHTGSKRYSLLHSTPYYHQVDIAASARTVAGVNHF